MEEFGHFQDDAIRGDFPEVFHVGDIGAGNPDELAEAFLREAQFFSFGFNELAEGCIHALPPGLG
jgi:hypothetical protein